MPLILNQVASVADAVDDIAFGTANGPTRFGPLLRAISAASTTVRVDGPPEPMMMPVRGLEISVSASPESRIACSMATWFQAAPPPRKRMARRSTEPLGSSVGAPCTWLRKPSSAYFSARTTPDLASRSDASTSCALLPMDETMPIPVTTTRLIFASSQFGSVAYSVRHDLVGKPAGTFPDHAQAPLACGACSRINATLMSSARQMIEPSA